MKTAGKEKCWTTLTRSSSGGHVLHFLLLLWLRECFCTFTKNHVIITADFLLFSCALSSNVKVPPIIYMHFHSGTPSEQRRMTRRSGKTLFIAARPFCQTSWLSSRCLKAPPSWTFFWLAKVWTTAERQFWVFLSCAVCRKDCMRKSASLNLNHSRKRLNFGLKGLHLHIVASLLEPIDMFNIEVWHYNRNMQSALSVVYNPAWNMGYVEIFRTENTKTFKMNRLNSQRVDMPNIVSRTIWLHVVA